MINKWLDRIFTFWDSGWRDLAVALAWVLLGVSMVITSQTDAFAEHYSLLSGFGLLIGSLGIGALVDISFFQDWKFASAKMAPLEQFRRVLMMVGAGVVMAMLLWLWGRL